ncbi:MAG: hypothetical protein K2O97_01955, partial [Acetatifactor sp.]|nr:hypothetical protein [Acetatifactor sp.]
QSLLLLFTGCFMALSSFLFKNKFNDYSKRQHIFSFLVQFAELPGCHAGTLAEKANKILSICIVQR